MARVSRSGNRGFASFVDIMHDRLGANLKELILFGSQARGDAKEGSDFDCLIVVQTISPDVVEAIDEAAGEVLLQHQTVISAFPISDRMRHERPFDPLLLNVANDGVSV
ncbi:MAG: nucleotidyltransferase domain-containing protein [Chitinivibrionales bacterium]|nr:nucleotidyltransferase domain-containing protein [Chitinivibrionales bacterium]MBD3394663.1 nucleotidyltransferase domain-containing protein [Chitinivibrionales bacterium]